MGFFDWEDKEKKPKKEMGFFEMIEKMEGYKDSIKKSKRVSMYKDLEAYSCDEEADEDGFFDEEPL